MNSLKITSAALVLAGVVSAQGFVGSFPLITTNGIPVGLEGDLTSGNLYFTDIGANDEYGTCDTTGAILSTVPTAGFTGNPIGITRDNAGNVYVTDTDATLGPDVDVYDAAGNYVSSFPVGADTTFPEGITFNPLTGNLYVVDGTAGNQCIEYTTAGTRVQSFPLNGFSIDGIAYDITSNSYWIYDSGTDSIRNYDASFVELSNAPGTGANGLGGGEGLAVLGGRLYVCATGSDAVGIFDLSAVTGSTSEYGQGCPAPSDWYELFPGPGSNDLSGVSFTVTPTASGFTVSAAGAFDPNFSNNLNSGDDQLFAAQPLGFTATFPSLGTTSAIDVDSNGRCGVGLPGSDFTESVGEFLGGNGAIVAACWDDFNPAAAGGVYWDQGAGFAMVTWDQVPQFGNTDANTFQVKFYADGRIEYNYVAVADDSLVGLSAGVGGADPGSIDISASLPFSRAGGGAPLGLIAQSRPVIGQTFGFTTTNIPATGVSGATIVGLLRVNQTIPGLPSGCTVLSSGQLATIPLNLANPSISLPITNDPTLIGGTLHFQSAIVDAGQTSSIPVILSNGLTANIGNI